MNMTLWGGCEPLFEFVDLSETEIMPNRMWTLSITLSDGEKCSLKWKWRADGLNESAEYRNTELSINTTIYSTFGSSFFSGSVTCKREDDMPTDKTFIIFRRRDLLKGMGHNITSIHTHL